MRPRPVGQHPGDRPPGVLERSPWWMPWAFVLVAFVVWSLSQAYIATTRPTDEQMRDLMVASCERVNELRSELNVHTEVLYDFLSSAADVRRASALTMEEGSAPQRISENAAREYQALADQVDLIHVVDCEDVIRTAAEQEGFLGVRRE